MTDTPSHETPLPVELTMSKAQAQLAASALAHLASEARKGRVEGCETPLYVAGNAELLAASIRQQLAPPPVTVADFLSLPAGAKARAALTSEELRALGELRKRIDSRELPADCGLTQMTPAEPAAAAPAPVVEASTKRKALNAEEKKQLRAVVIETMSVLDAHLGTESSVVGRG